MATRFEMVLCGEDPVRLRAAADEAANEIIRLEQQLSFYDPTSEISGINAHAAARPVKVEPRLFRLLQRAAELSALTNGAFDITVAPLMRCWKFRTGGRVPATGEIEEALALVGMESVSLDAENFTISFARPGMAIDLGAIGKGYAVDQACELLREAGVQAGFVHGGNSTMGRVGGAAGGRAPMSFRRHA